MEANKEEALHALSLAKKYLAATPPNVGSARKLTLKSIALCETSEAHNLLERIRLLEEKPKEGNGSAKAHSSGAEAFAGSEGVKHRHHTTSTSTTPGTSTPPTSASANAKGKNRDDEKRDYTPEQIAVVKKIKKCKVTEYYEILSLTKECDESDVKKAYRKLALQLHPDKNGAPGADEAFKMVSKAFQILSDPSLRAAFDRDGGDPESRFGGGGMRSAGAGMRSPFRSNGSFEGEISPEDLFNMFFGGGFPGGGGGAQFGGSPFGGPMFTASFGSNGFATNRPRHFYRADAPAPAQTRGLKGAMLQLLPIFLFLFVTFGSSFLDILSDLFTTPQPSYSFTQTGHFNYGRVTQGGLKVPYWVNSHEFTTHSMMAAKVEEGKDSKPTQEGTTYASTSQTRSPGLKRFESSIEERWQNWKYNDCIRGRERIERKVENLRGFMGIGTDWEAIKKVRAEKIEACEDLTSRGFRIG